MYNFNRIRQIIYIYSTYYIHICISIPNILYATMYTPPATPTATPTGSTTGPTIPPTNNTSKSNCY